jgi:hypothetical protein
LGLVTALALTLETSSSAEPPDDPFGGEPGTHAEDSLSAGKKATLAALEESTTLSCRNAPLEEVVELLRERHKVNIRLDSGELDYAGIREDTPVNFSAADISLRKALELMLGDLDLTWTVRQSGMLLIVPSELTMITRLYDVSDLSISFPQYPYSGTRLPTTSPKNANGAAGSGMSGGMGGFFSVRDTLQQPGLGMGGGMGSNVTGEIWDTSPPSAIVELLDVISCTIEPQSWEAVGGPGSCIVYGRLLVVSQTAEVHGQILELLDAVRTEMRKAATVVLDIRWLLLDSDELDRLLSDKHDQRKPKGGVVVNRKKLERMTRNVPSFRGSLCCFNGQRVHLACGDRRSVVTGAVPVVENALGYEPVVVVPNVGILVEIRPSIIHGTDAMLLDVQSTVTSWRESGPELQVGGRYPPRQNTEISGKIQEAKGGASTVKASGEISSTSGGLTSVSIDRVTMPTHRLTATVRIPLGQPVLVGGLTLSPNEDIASDPDNHEERKQLYLIVETNRICHD